MQVDSPVMQWCREKRSPTYLFFLMPRITLRHQSTQNGTSKQRTPIFDNMDSN